MALTEQDKNTLRRKISDALEKLQLQIQQLEENTQPISPENSIGRVSRMDAINNKGVSEAALRTRKQKLAKLKIAFAKIEEEGFGICERCKKSISLPRLMFMPESNFCIHCAN